MEDGRLAYMAGIIDCLGGIRVRRTPGGTDLPGLFIHAPALPILDLFATTTGTRVIRTTRSYNRHLCADHCPEAHQHIESVSGRWSVTGVKATVVLYNVAPYLIRAADDAADALTVGLAAPFKPATPRKMADLGWPLPPAYAEESP